MITAQALHRALRHAVNYHSLDTKLDMADYRLAALLVPEVRKHLMGTTDVQIIERMTPEERANIGREHE